ncbi:MAG: lipid-A-disaccharide synthase [Verrucomicrobiota bacterium]
MEKKFYIVAGEASGDRNAALLIRELKRLYPQAEICGVGGDQMRNAGQDQLFDLAAHAVVGLTDVLWNYFKFLYFFYRVVIDIRRKKPDALILVDYPGFNLSLAQEIKRRVPALPIIYYIGPQVWAWKSHRSRIMSRVVDLLLVIFEFEKQWFAEREPKLKVEWVGHPLMDRWLENSEKQETNDQMRRIALLPGSREKEISRHLPILLETAQRVRLFMPDVTFVLLTPDAEARQQTEKIIHSNGAQGLNIEAYSGYQLTHLERCDLALVASGSATLECCVAGVPMLVLYKTSSLTFWIGRQVVKLPFIGMVNILAGEKIVPEFLQEKARADYLTEAIRKMAARKAWRDEMKDNLRRVTQRLGGTGGSRRAAEAIQKLLTE